MSCEKSWWKINVINTGEGNLCRRLVILDHWSHSSNVGIINPHKSRVKIIRHLKRAYRVVWHAVWHLGCIAKTMPLGNKHKITKRKHQALESGPNIIHGFCFWVCHLLWKYEAAIGNTGLMQSTSGETTTCWVDGPSRSSGEKSVTQSPSGRSLRNPIWTSTMDFKPYMGWERNRDPMMCLLKLNMDEQVWRSFESTPFVRWTPYI